MKEIAQVYYNDDYINEQQVFEYHKEELLEKTLRNPNIEIEFIPFKSIEI